MHLKNNNICLTSYKLYKEQQHLLDFVETLQDCYFFQHVTESTRYREGERSNILDLIPSSEKHMVQDLTYHPPIGVCMSTF